MGDPACWSHLFDGDQRNGVISDSLSARLLRELSDAVVVADREEIIVFWNRAAERIFGWSAAEAIGKPLDLIVPPRHRQAHSEGYRRVMESGETKYAHQLLRVPGVHRGGEKRSLAFTVTLLLDREGEPAGVAAVIRDETERWAEEQALRARLRDVDA